jgi:hypothetical protein
MPGLSDANVKQIELDAWISGINANNLTKIDKQKMLECLFPDEQIERQYKLMLYSFGGGRELQGALVKNNLLSKWKIPDNWKVLINMKKPSLIPSELNGKVLFFSHEKLNECNLNMIDIMQIVDVICCKTGYGIVSETLTLCSIEGLLKGVMYADRPGFCEHELLERALRESLGDRCRYVQMKNDVLLASDHLFKSANKIIEAYNELNSNSNLLPMNGGPKAASIICNFLSSIVK